MEKITYLLRKKVILIIIAILVLCGIITLIIYMNMYSESTQNKAIYVFEILKVFYF